jgi:putative transposase
MHIIRNIIMEEGTWYPYVCKLMNIKHHLHSSYEKSIIERTIQYVKDRTECFDDYFPCTKSKCKLNHVKNWFNLFVYYYNKEVIAQVNSAAFHNASEYF